MLHHLKSLRTPKWEHYEITYRNENMWAYLGNGLTEREMIKHSGGEIDLAPYIRNADEPWSCEPDRSERDQIQISKLHLDEGTSFPA